MKKFILGSVLAVAFTAAISLVGGFNISAAGTAMSPVSTANLKVADISHYNTVSNWTTAATNLDAVYIKATEGSTYTDATCKSSAQSAQNVNLKYGFYHYLWPYADTANAVKQADYFYSTISKYSYSCVPALDVEEANGMTKAQITADITAFATEFKKLSGQDIMIYVSSNFIDEYLGTSLSNYKLWVANYSSSGPQTTTVWSQWTMWQYSGSGTVCGIKGTVDCDKATVGILLNIKETNTISGDGYSLIIDKYYTDSGSTRTFDVTAAHSYGMLMIVSTLDTGAQTISYLSTDITAETSTISVSNDAVKTAVYIVDDPCYGTSIPKSYGLVQFVTANQN